MPNLHRVQWKHVSTVCPDCDGTWLKERQMFLKCRSCGAWFLSAKWAASMVEINWWVAMRSVQANG